MVMHGGGGAEFSYGFKYGSIAPPLSSRMTLTTSAATCSGVRMPSTSAEPRAPVTMAVCTDCGHRQDTRTPRRPQAMRNHPAKASGYHPAIWATDLPRGARIPPTARCRRARLYPFSFIGNHPPPFIASLQRGRHHVKSPLAVNNPSIAAVAAAWLLTGLFALAHAEDSNAAAAAKQKEKGSANAIVSIAMTPVAQTLLTGATVQYRAIATYQNGAIRDVTNTATWSVADINGSAYPAGACASISATGLLTAGYCGGWGNTMAVSLGDVAATGYITSTYGNSSQVTLSPGSSVTSIGATQQYTATWDQLNNASGPRNYNSQSTWTSSNPAVATVSVSGLVTSLAPGKTVITAAAPSFQYEGMGLIPNTNSPVSLTVVPCEISSITISPPMLVVLPEETAQIIAVGRCRNNSHPVDLTSVVDWQTSAPAIAMVNATGLVAAWTAGTATITASIQNVTSQPLPLQVAGLNTLTSIRIFPTLVSLGKAGMVQLRAFGTHQDGSTHDITDTVSWNTDTVGIVYINAKGQVWGLADGTVWISATSNGVSSPAQPVWVH